ncbi:Serine/threonine-protein kinase nak1 [Portunus trituberculatus]|uniref:Serine/threonine-protein kinase nak1 n=1 Tax=Portunus trituberculatus TaxID=210409 RepID=A0A5B7F505_PORTR|nr:Serine/threonine-protein kinase nak1 [Portunus trituberculatus]
MQQAGDIPVIKQKFLKKGRLLGSGCFANVYKGKLALSRHQIVRVAVKEPVNDAEKLAWVLHELQGVEGVPKLYGVTDATPPGLVMGLCRGVVLQALWESGEVELCVVALVKLCSTVRHLHALGVTHGDIHKGNVLVDVSDEGEVEATLLDFGLAERFTDATRQVDDVREVVSTALQVLAWSGQLCGVRRSLHGVEDLDSVEVLLAEALSILQAVSE